MRVTQNQLVDILEKTDADNVTVLYEKPVKMNKRGNPFFEKQGNTLVPIHDVTKRVIDTFGFGRNYAKEVNKELKRQGKEANYEAKNIPWKDTVVQDKVYRHKENGTLYLQVFMMFLPNTPIVERTTEYFVDGEPATDEEMRIIDEFEVSNTSGVKKQELAGLTNENQVKPNTIKFDNIISIVVDDTMYELM